MSGGFGISLIREALRLPATAPLQAVYTGAIARFIAQTLNNARDATVDQHQSNGAHCVHQLRVRLPGDPTVYRVLIATAETPISIGTVAADDHFGEPIA